jgi:tetratricopeptide (TPR) repeat protein
MGVGLLGTAQRHAFASQTPASGERMLREGITLLGRNELDQAQARFEQLLKAGLETRDAYYYLGLIHERRGDLSAAVTAFEAALTKSPGMARAHDRLGFVLGQQGRTVEAVEHFREAVRLDPKLADAHYHLGATL